MIDPLVNVKIGDESYELKPTFEVISKIETGLGVSVTSLAFDLMRKRGLIQTELFLILKIAIEATGAKIAPAAIEKYITEHRLQAVELVSAFLLISFRPREYLDEENPDKKKHTSSPGETTAA